jgi:hypothetical protein
MRIFIFLLIFSFVSCSTAKIASSNYKILFSGQNAPLEKKNHSWIKNNEEYISAIEMLNIDVSNYESLLDINFEINNICILYLGQRNTGGYSIEVEAIKMKNKILYIKQKETSPSKNENVTMAVTNPFCIVVIPKSNSLVVK